MYPKQVTIWAESEAEAQEMLTLLGGDGTFTVKEVFVAKKSGGKRDVGHKYLKGVYFPYDLERQAVLNQPHEAPAFITDLVQWCSPDIIISTDERPILCLEITYHILTFNNVAQRIPRMVRGASQGVPSIIFQKVDYELKLEISWFVKTFEKAGNIYNTPCQALLFNDGEFNEARAMLIEAINALVNDPDDYEALLPIEERMQPHVDSFDEKTLLAGKRGRKRNWIKVTEDEVIVSFGVRDNCALKGIEGYGCQGDDASKIEFRRELKNRPLGEKGCVWLSKGTGGMDPYPGLAKMSEILFCYDENGKRIRRLVSEFSKLPEDFWWFKKNTEEIYYKLINTFSDEVRYSDTYK